MNASIIVAAISSRLNRDYKNHCVVTVKCPHCGDLHKHGIQKDTKETLHHRGGDCGKGAYYITTRI